MADSRPELKKAPKAPSAESMGGKMKDMLTKAGEAISNFATGGAVDKVKQATRDMNYMHEDDGK